MKRRRFFRTLAGLAGAVLIPWKVPPAVVAHEYVGKTMWRIVPSRCVYQVRTITAYDPSTNMVTLSKPWSGPPETGEDVFIGPDNPIM